MNIDILLNEAIYLLKNIIEIPSFSREEDKVSLFLSNYILSKGLSIDKIGNNILILNKERYKTEPTILLNSHIDTVHPVKTWTNNPFKAEVKNDRIYGLGSNDAGASLVTLLLTAIYLYPTTSYNLAFCASAEEEISGKNGIAKVLEKYPYFDLAIVGEPTEMQPAVAEKGLMVLDGVAMGKAGHAARNEGINAIYTAFEDIKWFKEYKFNKISPFLGTVNMNVTQINAGTQHNVIPDMCQYVVDVRGNGCYSNQEIVNIIKNNISSTITPRSTRLNSSHLDTNHPFYHHLIQHGFTPFGSPTLSDQALMPFPSIKIGPGHSSRSHTANEYIYIKELEDALIKYRLILKEFHF